ncbi:putative Cytidine deaminase [Hypsibius exemplaris]|uniref:Cytidine deaminase n=1 Tax=Hypsibius exemplaris TaxID=2072580 RepID=A0A1W0XF74_HYPEX|nr:putative Cytidine deaminase [Hypsibius exemplaris]
MAESVNFSLLQATDSEIRDLIRACQSVKKEAYCVYSEFRVGAALLTEHDRHIITGCNVENASYGLTVCAERSAICSAVSRGYRKFPVIAVTSDVATRFCTPCGACRQFIAEFSPSGQVLLVKPGYQEEEYMTGTGIQIISVANLLPLGFTPNDLILAKSTL